jgi:hypothetical protein
VLRQFHQLSARDFSGDSGLSLRASAARVETASTYFSINKKHFIENDVVALDFYGSTVNSGFAYSIPIDCCLVQSMC